MDKQNSNKNSRDFADAKNNLLEIIHDFDKYRNQVELKKEALKLEPGIFEKSLNSFFILINLVFEKWNQFIDLIKSQLNLVIEFKNNQILKLNNFGLKLTHQIEGAFLKLTHFRKNFYEKSFKASSNTFELLNSSVASSSHIYSQTKNGIKQVVPTSPQVILRAAAIFGLVTAIILPTSNIVAFAEETSTEVVSTETTPSEPVPADSPSPEPSASEAIEVGSEVIVDDTSSVEPSAEVTESVSPTPTPSPSIPLVVVNAPTNLNFTPVVEGIKLTWDKTDSEIDKYVVKVDPDNRQIDVSKDASELLLADLDRKATYSFSVWAVSGEVSSEVTGPLTVDLSTIKFPRPPMNAEVGGLIVKFDGQELSSQDLTNIADTTQLEPVSLEVSSEIATDTRLVEFNQPVDVNTANEIADALEANNSVEYAELDFAFLTASETNNAESFVPNDPLYATKQWSLWGNFGVGIADGPTGFALAYQNSTGLGSVVAVIDTGFTNHPDLEGQFVSGYDFVSNNEMLSGIREENGTAVPYDGDYIDQATYGSIGWDDNPQDPGDWNSTRSSSWHGTYIAGLIAAKTNNGIGIAGIAPDAKIQPIRAFSWRGGLLSDVIASITWASGGTVENVPANQTPAKVINLSFSVEAPCTPSLQLAIDEAISRGSVVVAAAGNNNQDAANFAPGNCQNVITVGAINSDGEKAAYSNFGASVDLSAPGGELNGQAIYSTSNEGSTTVTNPAYVVRQGTSIATAQVSAAIAKLTQTYPTENAVQLKARILSKESTKPFPIGKCLTEDNCGIGYLFFDTATAAVTVTGGSFTVGSYNNLGISLTGFSASEQTNNYQATIKFVDASDNDVSNGNIRVTQGSTSAVTGYASASGGFYTGSKVGFSGTYSQVLTAIQTATWNPASTTGSIKLRVAISTKPGTNEYYNGNTGRYYKYISSSGVSWATAKADAANSTLYGLNGYLVHITTKAENDFVSNETSASNIWIGATDAGVEGQWKFDGATISGENSVFNTFSGSTLTSSLSGYGLSSWYSGRVAGWALNEPNDAGSNEDCAVTNWGGAGAQWNDLSCTSASAGGYLIEYGGAGGTSTAVSASLDSTLSAVAGPVITTVSPSSGPTKGSSSITITGTNFTGATSVTIGGVAASSYTVDSSTQITAVTPAGTVGAKDVAVATSVGSDTETNGFTYVSGISNGNFDTGTTGTKTGTDITGWNIVTTRVDLGITNIAGCTSIDSTDYQSSNLRGNLTPESDDAADFTGTYSGSVALTNSISSGPSVSGNAVKLTNSTSATGYHVIHGPVVYSDAFGANAGDVITLDWYAKFVSDDYAVLGYLLNTNGCSQTEVIDSSGTTVSGWQNASVTIPATSGTYRFVFVHGTFDKSGGTVGGAEMYIDNITSGTAQTVSFSSPAAGSTQNSDFTVVATASSNLTVSYGSSTTSVCTVDSSTGLVTRVSGGTCTITASQLGNDTYAAATASRSFTVQTGPTNTSVPTISGTATFGQTLTSGNGSWNNQGSAITSYTYQWQSGVSGTYSNIPGATSSTFVLTEDEVGKNIRVQVVAINAVASSNAANSSATSLVSATTAGAPSISSITAGNQTLTVIFTAPISNGGASITNYKYSTDGTNYFALSPATTSSPITISFLSTDGTTLLSNGVTYSITLKALNSVGDGTASSSVNATPVAPSSGGTTVRPTPTPTPSPSRTPSTRPTNLITNPLTNPTPTLTPSPSPTTSILPGTLNNPSQLVKRTIEELITSLRPRIIDLFTTPTPTASIVTGTNTVNPVPVPTFDNQRALELIPTTPDKKVVELPSLVLVNDIPEPSKVVIVDNTTAQIVTPGGGLLNVAAKDGEERIPVDNRGRVQMVRENNVETEGKGMAPNTEFAVYLFSEPILLGVGKTDNKGQFFASFPVENALPIGDHTLQVNGLLPDGKTASISMPVTVVDSIETAKNQAMPKTIFVSENPIDKALRAVYWILIVLAAMVFLIAAANRKRFFALFRRRDDDGEPQII